RSLNARSVNQNFWSYASNRSVSAESLESLVRMLQPGSRHGRYEIRSLLGAGRMGEVYLAHDAQLQRPVALKVLAGEMRDNDDLRKRLEHEARAASALNHPNILTVYDVGLLGEDHFIATEY